MDAVEETAPSGVWADRSEAQTRVIATHMTTRCVGRFIRASSKSSYQLSVVSYQKLSARLESFC